MVIVGYYLDPSREVANSFAIDSFAIIGSLLWGSLGEGGGSCMRRF